MKKIFLLLLSVFVVTLSARNFDGTGPCGEGPGSGYGCGNCQLAQGRFCCKNCPFMGSLQQDSLATLEAKEQMLSAMLKEVQAEKARRA